MRPMPELKITELPVSELVEYAGNAKLHPHEQVDQIANSISEFGNNDPIAVWHNENGEPEIVEGHGRLMALRKLGIETAPVIYLDHLSDEQRRAYALVHNKLTMNSDFDFEILQSELEAVESLEMGDFGFDELDIDFMDFDGLGDGGGSRMQGGSFVRVVIGPFICDFKDENQKYYPLAAQLDDEQKVCDAIKSLFDEGILP